MSVFDKKSILFYIFVGFVLIVCVKMYYDSEAYNLKCIISTIDGETYCVREREKLQVAADLLAKVAQKCKDLVLYCAIAQFPSVFGKIYCWSFIITKYFRYIITIIYD